MKTNLLKSALLLLAVTCSVNMMATDFEIDLRQAPLGYGDSFSAKYLVVGTPYTYSVDKPETYDAFFEADRFNENTPSTGAHGYVRLKVTIPVVAGNYKVTLGSCRYGTGTGYVENANKTVLANFDQKLANCYHQDVTNNIVSATFSVAAIDTIKVICGNYTPYIKFEALSSEEYTVSFTNTTEGVEGSLPASTSVVAGESFTIPANRTLYKEGYTLTGWNDGENTYAIGADYTPTQDVTMTPVFTENAFDVLTATSDITVLWDFQTKNGAPVVAWEGANAGTGFLVAQAILGNNQVDVKLTVDATSGKFNNKSSDSWCQINSGTLLTFPSKKAAIVVMYTLDPDDNTLDGNAGTYDNHVATYTVGVTTGTSVLTFGAAGRYYRYLQVVYPASDPTALEQTDANAKATKILRDGILLIEKNGKLYTAQGVEVR